MSLVSQQVSLYINAYNYLLVIDTPMQNKLKTFRPYSKRTFMNDDVKQ